MSFRFEYYLMHGHLNEGPANYVQLLNELQYMRGYDLKVGNHHTAVGLSGLDPSGKQLFLVIYTGYSEKSTLFFDVTATKELTEASLPGRFPARKTYAMIDANKRLLTIQAKKGNLGSLSLASLIEEYIRTKSDSKFKGLELSFTPLIDEQFLDKLNELERIRSATITIVRPNVDWTDQHNKLTEVAKESDARSLDVTARAKRAKSLSKDRGIIRFIKSGSQSVKSMFQKIKVVGSLSEDSGLITLDLNKHINYSTVLLDTDSNTGLPRDSDVRPKLSELLRNTKRPDERN